MPTATTDRVPRHTADPVNRAIRDETERSVEHFRSHPEQVPNRLARIGFRTPSEIEAERCALEQMGRRPASGLATKRLGVVTGAAFVAPMIARAAAGCPLCISDTGAQLRAMLASDPAWHLAVTIAPIPAIIAVVALVRAATPFLFKDEP